MYQRSQTAMRKGKNTCAWIKIPTTERCGRSCMEEYCYEHRQMIRHGRPTPTPCQRCGIGTQSKTRQCKKYGQQSANNHLHYIETRARKQYSLVIDDVKAGDFHLKRSMNDDICTNVFHHIEECHGKTPTPAPRRRRAVVRPTPKPRKPRLADRTVTDAEMDAYIEELLAEMPQ